MVQQYIPKGQKGLKKNGGRGCEKQIIVKDFTEDTTLDGVRYRKGFM